MESPVPEEGHESLGDMSEDGQKASGTLESPKATHSTGPGRLHPA